MVNSLNNPANLHLKVDDNTSTDKCAEFIFPLEIFQHIASFNLFSEGKLRRTCKKINKMTVNAKIDANEMAQFIRNFGRALTKEPLSEKIDFYKVFLKSLIPRIEDLNIWFSDLEDEDECFKLNCYVNTANVGSILKQIPHFKKIDFKLEPYAIQTFRNLNTFPQCETGQFVLRFDENNLKTDIIFLRDFWELISLSSMKDIKIAFDAYEFPNFSDARYQVIKTFENPTFNSLTMFFNSECQDYLKIYLDLIEEKFSNKFIVNRITMIGDPCDFNDIWINRRFREYFPDYEINNENKFIEEKLYELVTFERIESRKRKGEDLTSEVTKKAKIEIL